MSAVKPQLSIHCNPDGLPDELREKHHWVLWKYWWHAKRKKWVKMPINPATGVPARTNQPQTWTGFDEARAAFERAPGEYGGLGYVFNAGDGITGIDLDHCIDSAGTFSELAQEAIRRMPGYWERSPSGTGLHLIGLGEVPKALKNDAAGVEVYGAGRFFCMTGVHADHPALISYVTPNLEPVRPQWLFERYTPAPSPPSPPPARAALTPPAVTGVKGERVDSPGGVEPPSFFRRVNDLALQQLGDWVPVLFPEAQGTQAGGYRITSAQLGRDLEEDLSIAPNGIIDFGVHDMGDVQAGKRTAIDLVREYYCQATGAPLEDTPTPAGAALWLCQQMSVEPKSLGYKQDSKNEKAKELRTFKLLAPGDFAYAAEPCWIIKRVMPETGLAMVYGESGAGKSFVILDIVQCLARGAAWNGMAVTRPVRVVYIIAEGAGDFRLRLRAVEVSTGVHLDDFELRVIDEVPNFMADDYKGVCDALASWGNVGVVVVDTLAQVVAGGNENASEDMGQMLISCRALQRATNGLVLLVHHAGKDMERGARGWSGIKAACDAEYKVSWDGQSQRQLTVTKLKGGQEGAVFPFVLRSVPLGEDADGYPLDSCCVEYVETRNVIVTPPEPKGSLQKSAYSLIQSILGESGHTQAPADQLITEIARRLPPNDGKDRRRWSARRALESLAEQGFVTVLDDLVALPGASLLD